MKIIVGLGNPGRKYERTRHNAGFMAVDELARSLQLEFIQERHHAFVSKRRARYNGNNAGQTPDVHE